MLNQDLDQVEFYRVSVFQGQVQQKVTRKVQSCPKLYLCVFVAPFSIYECLLGIKEALTCNAVRCFT